MDASDLTVTVARLSIRLSRVVEFIGSLLMVLVGLLGLIVGALALCGASLYLYGGLDYQKILIGEVVLLAVLLVINRFVYRKLIRHFYSS